jgi:2-polyprenyl-3-methyl-5-hydroxy-6-metoxy-1,4-benzoquinol methylase
MAEKHFYEQREFTNKFLLPYFRKHIDDLDTKKVFEIGCAEGGLIETFHNNGIEAGGLEISSERAAMAKEKNPALNIYVGDITDPMLTEKIKERFDFIIMREVIEHLRDKKIAFDNIDKLLNKGGYLFVSFPPKFSPFAGHQQIGSSFMKAIPYLHILPAGFLKIAANTLHEKQDYIDEIKLHFSTGCRISEFEKLYKGKGFSVLTEEFFLFRPIYAIRFGLPTIGLPNIPFFREFISFGCETLLKKNDRF